MERPHKRPQSTVHQLKGSSLAYAEIFRLQLVSALTPKNLLVANQKRIGFPVMPIELNELIKRTKVFLVR